MSQNDDALLNRPHGPEGFPESRQHVQHSFWHTFRRALQPIASLRLTVVLFALSLGLVFFGTVAQKHKETFTVVDEYFYSWVAFVPFQLFAELGKVFLSLDPNTTFSGSFPWPGGFLMGWALLTNLTAAHLVRFKISWKRSGILLIHSGLAVLLIGEYVTRGWAVESTMSMAVGERVNHVDVSRKTELAFVGAAARGVEDASVIPESFLHEPGLIRNEALPVDVDVLEFHPNSIFEQVKESDPEAVSYSDSDGRTAQVKFVKTPEESGTGMGRANAPMVRVTLKEKGSGKPLGTYRLSQWSDPNYTKRTIAFSPQTVKVGEKTYTVSLRPKRVYKPYTIELLKFEHEVYPGTTTPKDFASTVRLTDAEWGEERQVRIWMNHPLRHGGETFYQSQYFPDDSGTVLQVVQNPAATFPYVACIMVAGGMVVHFLLHLSTFLRRRFAA